MALGALRSHGERDYPNEACGLLVGAASAGRLRIEQAVAVPNLNTERAKDRYTLDPAAHREADERARREGRDIVGVYHSHPDHPARPSETDRAQAYPEWAYVIVSVERGKAGDVGAFVLGDWDGVFAEVPIETS